MSSEPILAQLLDLSDHLLLVAVRPPLNNIALHTS